MSDTLKDLDTLIGVRAIQVYLRRTTGAPLLVDGVLGPETMRYIVAAVRNIGIAHVSDISDIEGNYQRYVYAVVQMLFQDLDLYAGEVDGFAGPQTQYALEQFQNLMRDEDDTAHLSRPIENPKWPVYKDLVKFYGPVGRNQQKFKLPYEMFLAWDKSTMIKEITLHEKVGESAMRVLARALDFYGPKGISNLGLDMFGGSLNVRKMRGGSRWSTHSWGIAIDIDPEHNQFRWTDKRARMARPSYDRWWSLWEEEGWVSLGRARNFDWMHVQACRL